jgi:hypothetical protein
MPHAVLKLVPGVNTTETPALNENAGISSSNLIRFQPDSAAGTACVQKLGGWSKFFPSVMAAIVRALWAWEDLNENAWLALGTQIYVTGGIGRAQLAVIEAGTLTDITPPLAGSVIPLASFSAVATIGSPSIVITDGFTAGITNADSVYIASPISVGGVVLYGLYPCDPDGYSWGTAYTVYARDILGNLLPATSTSAPVLPIFTTQIGSNIVTVTFPNTGQYAPGVTFPILVGTSVGGLFLRGDYVVQKQQHRHRTLQRGPMALFSSSTMAWEQRHRPLFPSGHPTGRWITSART